MLIISTARIVKLIMSFNRKTRKLLWIAQNMYISVIKTILVRVPLFLSVKKVVVLVKFNDCVHVCIIPLVIGKSSVPTTDSFTNSLSVLIRSTLCKETISRVITSESFTIRFYYPYGNPVTDHRKPSTEILPAKRALLAHKTRSGLALVNGYWLYYSW